VVEHVIKAILALSDRILSSIRGPNWPKESPKEVIRISKSSRPTLGRAISMLEMGMEQRAWQSRNQRNHPPSPLAVRWGMLLFNEI
jgi:hypothetical protein